jgi:hypothetical protein
VGAKSPVAALRFVAFLRLRQPRWMASRHHRGTTEQVGATVSSCDHASTAINQDRGAADGTTQIVDLSAFGAATLQDPPS